LVGVVIGDVKIAGTVDGRTPGLIEVSERQHDLR
jgi:hypothetical protein